MRMLLALVDGSQVGTCKSQSSAATAPYYGKEFSLAAVKKGNGSAIYLDGSTYLG